MGQMFNFNLYLVLLKSFCVDTLVFSYIGADIQILINPVNLPENKLPGTELSRAYDKDVAGRPNAYRFLNKTKDFVIDASKLIFYHLCIFIFQMLK